jgi:hypothetical protein
MAYYPHVLSSRPADLSHSHWDPYCGRQRLWGGNRSKPCLLPTKRQYCSECSTTALSNSWPAVSYKSSTLPSPARVAWRDGGSRISAHRLSSHGAGSWAPSSVRVAAWVLVFCPLRPSASPRVNSRRCRPGVVITFWRRLPSAACPGRDKAAFLVASSLRGVGAMVTGA